MDRCSQQGLHLIKPSPFGSSYVRDPSIRYVYRLDYQPRLRIKGRMKDYLDLYQDSGWEHMGHCNGWHFFRQVWTPEKTAEIYSDRESLKQQYNRLRRILGLMLFAESILLLVDLKGWLFQTSGWQLSHDSPVMLALLFAVVFMLGYGFTVMTRKVRNMQKL